MNFSLSSCAPLRLLLTGISLVTVGACGDSSGTTASDSGVASGTTESSGGTDSTAVNSGSQSDSDAGSATESASATDSDSDPTTGAGTGMASNSGEPGSTGTTGVSSAGTDSDGETGVMGECGNGVVEPGEQCDDGNPIGNDGCNPDCILSYTCGNGEFEPGEACDDGNTDDGDGCNADCQVKTPPQVCGNGTVEKPELCDDGNQSGGDGCDNDCTFSPSDCGNGEVEGQEQCDDGNQVDGGDYDYCKNDCTAHHPAICGAPETYVVCDDAIDLADKTDPSSVLRAIGICNTSPDDSIITTDFVFDPDAQPATWQVARGFGNYVHDHDNDPNTPEKHLYGPQEGDAFLILSTGVITPPNLDGVVVEPTNSQIKHGANGNSGDDVLPAPFKIENGSNDGAGGTPFKNCDNGVPDGDHDCSDTLQAQWTKTNGKVSDRIYFSFKTVVPEVTHGFTFDFVFCSSEWPTYANTAFNDSFIVYQVDPTPDDPNANPPVSAYSGNVAFIPDPMDPDKGLPVTITALDSYFKGPGFSKAEPQLWGTGFETHACSDWFTARGGVQPGAEITVGIFLADMSDPNWTTVALLDNFRWDCEGCVPSDTDDCGIKPG